MQISNILLMLVCELNNLIELKISRKTYSARIGKYANIANYDFKYPIY